MGFDSAAAEAAAAGSNALYAGLVSVPNIPNEFFKANVWRSPRHEAQESTSQLLLEKDFDQGQLTVAANVKKRVFYRDTSSLSAEAQSIRWSGNILNDSGVYLSAANANTIGGLTVSNTWLL